jgi:hypothetical protein
VKPLSQNDSVRAGDGWNPIQIHGPNPVRIPPGTGHNGKANPTQFLFDEMVSMGSKPLLIEVPEFGVLEWSRVIVRGHHREHDGRASIPVMAGWKTSIIILHDSPWKN